MSPSFDRVYSHSSRHHDLFVSLQQVTVNRITEEKDERAVLEVTTTYWLRILMKEGRHPPPSTRNSLERPEEDPSEAEQEILGGGKPTDRCVAHLGGVS